MRVLVTGATGFIGHHLVSYILEHTDWHVVTLDRLDVSSSLGRLVDVLKDKDKSRVTFIYHDLKAEINEITSNRIGPVGHIFHLAASSHVDRSILDPIGFVKDNVLGTTHLLDWARKLDSLETFFNFSTDEVFGPAPVGVFFKESDQHRPSNPYSASKSGADQIGYAYYITYGLPVVTTYTVNVFGERQFTEKFVSKAIKAILRKDPLDIHCYMEGDTVREIGTRSWIDVVDVCEAMLFLTWHRKAGQSYNIAGYEEIDNLKIARMIAEILEENVTYKFVDCQRVRPGYDNRYALSVEKMLDLGWKSSPVKEGLTRVVKWMANNQVWL